MTRCMICGRRIDDVPVAHEIHLEGDGDVVRAWACNHCHDNWMEGMPCFLPQDKYTFRVP